MDTAEAQLLPIFNLSIPTQLAGIDANILDPRATYTDAQNWYEKAQSLAGLFVDNFEKFTDTVHGRSLVNAGPKLSGQ